MSQHNRSSLFVSLYCGSHSLEDTTASQIVLLVSILGREGCALPKFSFKNNIGLGLCTTQAKVQPKYMTTLDDVECMLEFKEGMQMMDVK